MNLTIEQDRGAQFLMAAKPDIGFDEARLRLDRSSLSLSFDASISSPSMQCAALAAVASGAKMFRRGVYLEKSPDAEIVVGHRLPRSLHSALADSGCREGPPPLGATRVHIGTVGAATKADLFAWTDGWSAGVANTFPEVALAPGNELSGIFAGALAVSVAFRKAVLDDPLAGRRRLTYCLWEPGGIGTDNAGLVCLPSKLWLLGLGNLGQASLFVLSLLPYADPAAVRLLLNDTDVCGPENLPVQILTRPDWIGEKKVRCAAKWAERVGFLTVANERRFSSSTGPEEGEPRVALVGVDNLDARRSAAKAGFDLVIDAGLGATGTEAFDVRLHAFPGFRNEDKAWVTSEELPRDPPPLRPNLQRLIDQGLIDQCGAVTIAGQAVGVPCTALAAAAVQVAQACRAVETGRCCDLADFTLTNSKGSASHVMGDELATLAFVEARRAR